MPPLDELQSSFIDYLTGKTASLEALVAKQGRVTIPTRLNIYKNAYQIRLKEALETDHELLGIYLGDALFDDLAEGYIRQHPSHYTSLRHFGESLPDYLLETTPFKEHPILAEIARFERRLMDVFDAADAQRLDISALQQIPAEQWPNLIFRFHPSVQVLTHHWNSIESWKALRNNLEPPTAAQETSYWILWRGTDQLSEFRPMEEDEHAILLHAIKGENFATLCETLLSWHPETDIGHISIALLQRWFEQGLIISVS